MSSRGRFTGTGPPSSFSFSLSLSLSVFYPFQLFFRGDERGESFVVLKGFLRTINRRQNFEQRIYIISFFKFKFRLISYFYLAREKIVELLYVTREWAARRKIIASNCKETEKIVYRERKLIVIIDCCITLVIIEQSSLSVIWNLFDRVSFFFVKFPKFGPVYSRHAIP